jgi:hypothetical protein
MKAALQELESMQTWELQSERDRTSANPHVAQLRFELKALLHQSQQEIKHHRTEALQFKKALDQALAENQVLLKGGATVLFTVLEVSSVCDLRD